MHEPLSRWTPAWSLSLLLLLLGSTSGSAQEEAATFQYQHRLRVLTDPAPLFRQFPRYVEPIKSTIRYEAPPLIDDAGADLSVRCWRFSYNLRGVVEYPNRLRGRDTALIVVHPWGVDDGQGWRTPQPAGAAFQCTPVKNQLCLEHAKEVVQPLLARLRPVVQVVGYSLPGSEDPIRKQIYRSVRQAAPSEAERREGHEKLRERLAAFQYEKRNAVPEQLELSSETPLVSYFQQVPGLDAGPAYNGDGFWQLPIPVMNSIQVAANDVVFYDAEGYALLRDFLKRQGVRHVLLAGYNTDMCVCSTTAGYDNLRQDFNVFLVGDATLATFPANQTPAAATNAALSFASLKVMITQVEWIRTLPSTR